MPRQIKILHILHAFSAGGLENGLVNIINGSPDYLQHELCLLARCGDFLERLHRPVAYHELHKHDGNDLGILVRLHEIIRQTRANIVHTRNWGAFDGVLATCLTPRVVLLHGEHGRDIRDPEGLNRRRNFLRRFLGFRVEKFIAVSADLYRWLSQTVRIPERKLVLIPNGVDTKRYQPHRSPSLRQELNIGQDEFVVGCIGRLDPVKNHEGVIRAVALLHQKGVKVRLVIVGDGPHRPKLENLLQTSRLDPPPKMSGYQSDIEKFYGLFDVFVLNSFAEGMSNTLLEAMASSLPVVCTPVGGSVELVADKVRGRYVPVGDDAALAEIIKDYQFSEETRLRHGSNARRFIESNFSLHLMIQRYVQLYEATAQTVR